MAEDKVRAESAAKPCPICGKASTQEDDPFCSRRCADVDLNRWFNGRYAVPVRDEESEADGEQQTGET